MRHKTARPFTLLELISVMGVIILLAAVAIPAYSSLFSGRKTTLAANQLNGAVMEARAHAVSAKVYTALVFVKDGKGYKSFRMAEVYHDPEADSDGETSPYEWRRWAPGTAFVLLPENTSIPDSSSNEELGIVQSSDTENQSEITKGNDKLPEVTNLKDSSISGSKAPAIIFKPSGQLAGTGNKNVVVCFVESNRYENESAANKAPRLPLNINWLTCKTKFLDSWSK